MSVIKDDYFNAIMELATKRWKVPMALNLAGSEHGGADFTGRAEEAVAWLEDRFDVPYRYDSDEKVCYPEEQT